jgi:choline dehydrogenase-like flavoprotein
MIECLDQLTDDLILEADVCIIGTGAAGLTMALELIPTGIRVVMLEAGELGPTEEGQTLYNGEVAADGFRGLVEGRSRQFGGTTRLWGGQCARLDPIDFEKRSWIPNSGWPIPHHTLVPYYERAMAHFGVAAAPFAPDVWRRFGLESFDFDPAELHAAHGVFIRRPKLGRRYRATLDAAKDLKVLLRANVTHIGTNAYATEVSRVAFRGLNGKAGEVRARRVVLCAGGIENARLLLLSNGVKPLGLGNDRDLVGRYLNDHPCGLTATISTSDPRRLQDHFNMLYSRAAFYLPKMALSAAAQRREKTLNCVGRLTYDFGPASGIKALRDIAVDIHSRRWPEQLPAKLTRIAMAFPQFVPSAWRLLARGLSPAPRPARIFLETFAEQTPNPDSRVTLSDNVDRLGLRQVKVDWRLDALTGHTLRTFTNSVAREFKRLGLGVLDQAAWLNDPVPRYPDVLDSYHHAGATRMADDPSQGVVDTDCQVFGVKGLYVAGSSVFPTSGAANPTFSIAALAIRLADHIQQDLRAVPPEAAVVTTRALSVEDAIA